MMRTTISTVFAHPDAQSAHQQWRRVADGFRTRFPKLADLMDRAKVDVLAYASFPAEPWQKTWSNNPLERLNKEVKRRTEGEIEPRPTTRSLDEQVAPVKRTLHTIHSTGPDESGWATGIGG